MTFDDYCKELRLLVEESHRLADEMGKMRRSGATGSNPAFVQAQQRHRQIADELVALNRHYLDDANLAGGLTAESEVSSHQHK